jgi:tetratricopeptide (TPR) repeat protein
MPKPEAPRRFLEGNAMSESPRAPGEGDPTILVIDDEPANLQLIKMAVVREHFRCNLVLLDGARKALERIRELRDASTDPRFAYFRRQLELQQLAVTGWIAWAEGRNDEAIALLRYSADEEDALGKHPVSPGAIMPVRELLGDLYLELNRPADALAAFEQSLQLNPARYRGTAGAARAAELAGKTELARAYYRKLLELAKNGDGQRPEVAQAQAFLDGGTNPAGQR